MISLLKWKNASLREILSNTISTTQEESTLMECIYCKGTMVKELPLLVSIETVTILYGKNSCLGLFSVW